MATLSLTLVKAKVLKDGTHKIRIAIRHRHETRYIITRYSVADNQFKDGRVVKRPDASIVNTKLRGLLDMYQEKLDGIQNPELYDCKQLKDILQKPSEDGIVMFKSVSDNFIEQLIEEDRKSYAKMIEHSSRTFMEFCRGDIPLQGITPELVENYIRFLKKKGTINRTSINIMLSRLKVIVNRAISLRLVQYDVFPFVSHKIASSPVREVDLPLEAINKIRLSKPSLRKLIVARDAFMLSFYLGGINLVDLMKVDFRKAVLVYERTKTRNTAQNQQQVKLTIPPQAVAIAKQYTNKKGLLDFGYKFSYENLMHYVTRSLQALAVELNITERIVFYSARKSFAQFASDLGITDSVIDYCLGHSTASRGVIRYYTKIRQQQADAAIAKVIDYVENPSVYVEAVNTRMDMAVSV